MKRDSAYRAGAQPRAVGQGDKDEEGNPTTVALRRAEGQ